MVSSHMAFAPKTFVVNTNNPLISVLPKIDKIDAELAADVVKEIYELALLSQREMDPAHLNDFIGRSNRILEKLVNRLTE